LNIGYVTKHLDQKMPLGQYLEDYLPPRVMPSGSISSYSNHGYGLAGYLVEITAGMSYEEYIERNILSPLGMTHSSAFTPPPQPLREMWASGYRYDFRSGDLRPSDFGYRNLPPAGTISASAGDMARFLIAHLEGGRYGDAQLLSEDIAEVMHRRQFGHHPKLPGLAYGFYELFYNGHRLLSHAGGFLGASSLVVMAPDQNAGLFVAGNRMSMGPLLGVMKSFLEALYGAALEMETPVAAPGEGFEQRAGQYAGIYTYTRYSRRTLEKLAILDTQIGISVLAPGVISLQQRNREPTRWVEVEPYLFENVDNHRLLAFGPLPEEITHFYLSQESGLPTAFERLDWNDRLDLQLGYMYGAVLVILSTLLVLPIVALIRMALRRLKGRAKRPAPGHGPAWLMAWCNCLLMAALFIGLDALLGNSSYRNQLVFGLTLEMKVLLILPWLTLGLTLLMVLFLKRVWKRGDTGLWGPGIFTLITIGALLFIPFLWNWNLFVWPFS
jgi:hypothetical protein